MTRHWHWAVIAILTLYLMVVAAPRLLRAEAQMTFTNDDCTVTWYGDPRFGPWMYQLSCTVSSVGAAPGRAATGSPQPAVLSPREVVCLHFPGQCAFAIRVFYCESRLNPAAVGALGERGAAQIHPIWFSTYGYPPADLNGQMRQAAVMVADLSWSHWSCAR